MPGVDDLAQLTLGEALHACAVHHGERPALLCAERSLSYGELEAEVNRLAHFLASLGVVKGDAVGVMLTKRPEVVTTFLACARLGAIYAPVNFKLHPDHLRDQFETGDIQTLVTEVAFDGLTQGLLPALPDPRRIVYVGGRGAHGESDYSGCEGFGDHLPEVAVDLQDPVYYNYTSGTTGRPKGAITTHRNIQFNGLTAFDREGVDGLGFDESHVFLSMFSVFAHPHEIFHRSLLCAGSFVVVDTLSPRVIAETIHRFGVSWMMAVPSFYEMLLDHAEPGKHDLSSLRVLESGGAWVSPRTLGSLEERFGASFMPVWGSTETTGVAVAMRPDRDREPGATGRPVAGYEIQLVDRHGRPTPRGEVGEMVLRGEAVVRGYVNNPEESAALFTDGWYHTRDLMRWSENGFLEFVGRRSEMLKIGGIRVYPLEIEQVLKGHPDVRDVVVVRAEERIRGEVARAVVQLAEGSDMDGRGIRVYCRGRLANYKVPRIVEFWKEIPRLPNGKVDKAAVVAVPPDPARDER